MGAAEVAIVRRVLDAFAAGDTQAAAAVLSPDVRVHEAPSLPFGGEHTGTTAFLTMLGSLGAAYTVEVSGQELNSAGDRVLLEMRMTFTSRATGRSTTLAGVEVYRFTDGLISDIDVYYKDTKAMVDILTD